MKASILYAVPLASWAFAAPIVMVAKNSPHQPGETTKTTLEAFIFPTHAQLLSSSKVTIQKQTTTVGLLDNRPFTPSDDVTPSAALTAPRPLKSTYLLSLSERLRPKPKSKSKSKPQHLSPELSSILRAETGTTVTSKHHPNSAELESEAAEPFYRLMPCMKGGVKHFHKVRQYADMVIVCVVLVFVAIVVLIEIWDPVMQRIQKFRAPEGAIRLSDDENADSHHYRPFVLQPAPKSKSKLGAISVKEEI